MTTAAPHPPTTLHESTPLTPSSAESFLSAFLADASQKPNQNEIVLTNLLRVQQALAGVYVPPPPPTAADAEGGVALMKGEAGAGEVVTGGVGGGGYREAKVDGEEERAEVEVAPKIATVETTEAGGVDREKRRAKRKARRREERKAKEKGRKRTKKEKGKKGDESE